MKISMLTLALVAAICVGALGVGQALAGSKHATAAHTLTIAMHDPGCHWFLIGGKYTTSASVNGSVKIVNRDEATLKVNSRDAIRKIPVGKSIVVGHGNYVITMVGQATDDNYLKLAVH